MSTERVPPRLSKTFGLAAKALRTARGISQENFADQCDLDRTYISLLERGLHNPTIKTVWILARALGKSPRELIARTEIVLRGAEKSKRSDSLDQSAANPQSSRSKRRRA